MATTGRNELGAFLRSRRERADPQAAGIVGLERRRVPGLRREELAMLSGVSATYYARLEQGRDRHPSPQIVDALADALRLDAAERAHLHRLAGTTSQRAAGVATEGENVRPGVAHLLARWSELPAFVVNDRRDVLATTPLAGRVNPAWTPGTNLAEFAFLDPRARAVYPDWQEIAGQTVAGLRASAALETGGDAVGRLIDQLRRADETFAQMWSAQDVYDRTIGAKRIAVDGHGIVTLNFETFRVGGAAGQTLFVYFAEPDSPDEKVLIALADGLRRRISRTEAGVSEPLTAGDLPAVMAGYRLAAGVAAMAELGIPDLLAERPSSADELAARVGCGVAELDRLLRMLVSRGALGLDGSDRYENTALSAALAAGPLRDMISGWAALPSVFAAWGSLADGLRAGRSPFEIAHGTDLHGWFAAHPAERDRYWTAMSSTVESFDSVAARLDLAAADTVVCVGGGSGVELVPVLRRWPQLSAVLVDLPDALETAPATLEQYGVADRVHVLAQDGRDGVPSGDAYLMTTVLRCLDDAAAIAVLTACRRSAKRDARVYLVEMVLPDGAPQHPNATADLTAWVAYGGCDRTVGQWRALLSAGGWQLVEAAALDESYTLLTGQPAAMTGSAPGSGSGA